MMRAAWAGTEQCAMTDGTGLEGPLGTLLLPGMWLWVVLGRRAQSSTVSFSHPNPSTYATRLAHALHTLAEPQPAGGP